MDHIFQTCLNEYAYLFSGLKKYTILCMNSISIFSSPNPGHPFKEVMVTLKGGNLKMHKVKTGQVKLFLNNDTIKILKTIRSQH